MKEIGIYIHIPFCKEKCYYCDFISFAKCEDRIEKYIEALKKEIEYRKNNNVIVKTIFIGGGTPSYINQKYIEDILDTVKRNYNISKEAEITIEVNPKTVNEKKLLDYFSYGINRLSIGLQTSNNNILKQIGRIHNYEEYLETIKLAKQAKFTNINTDIIIGLPNQTIYDVENTINKLIDLNLTHISIYSLIVEEDTKLSKMIENGEIKLPDEEIERYMYWFAKRKLEKNGFMHYEISNFAKPGFMSKHNLDCWSQREYFGFGVSASSYEERTRYSNINSIDKYIKNIKNNDIEKNKKIEEKQSFENEMNEYMILGLRKINGINISGFKDKFKKDPMQIYKLQLKKLFEEDLLVFDIDNIKLSKKGLDLANLVWEEFVE